MSNISSHFPFYFVLFLVLGAVVVTSQFDLAAGQDSPDTSENFLTNCAYVAPTTSDRTIAYVDWPFKLGCNDLEGTSGVPLSSPYSKCYVSSRNLPIQSSDFSITLNRTSQYLSSFTISQVINESHCYRTDVSVELRVLPSRDCSDDVEYYVERNVNVINKVVKFGDKIEFKCFPASSGGNEAILPPEVPASQYKTTWFRTKIKEDRSLIAGSSCENYTAVSLRTYDSDQIRNPGHPDNFVIHNANFYDPAIYSCSVTYKDQTAFVAHYSVCVENEVDKAKPSIQCNKMKSFFEDDTVEIECSVQTSNARITKDEMEIQWSRDGGDSSFDCKYFYDSPEKSRGPRATCDVINFNNYGTKCFGYRPDTSELSKYQDKNTFDIKYTLNNVKKSDAGEYKVKLRYQGSWSDQWTVSLNFNPARELRRIITILVAVLAVLVGIVVAIGMVWYHRIQILLFVRRHFRNPTEDNKKFVAILSYLFSSGLSEEAREQTKKIVRCIRKRMEKMEYKFYDKHEDMQGGSSVETLLKYLNESHRMVIVLTDAYVGERWSRFEAQQGYINMMKNKTKLIIVRAPGARRALKRSSDNGEEFSKELMEALKASRNICWKQNMKEERFMDDIEYALPNLKRSSSSSSNEKFFEFNKLENIDRGISNETTSTSMPSSPDSSGSFKFGQSEDIV